MTSNVYHKALIVNLLAAGFLSQACAANTPSVSPSETPFTKSETPSSTSRPSHTPRPTFTDTVAPDVAETAYYATLQAVETASIQTIVSTVQPVILAEHPSADGLWRAEVIRYDCINYPYPDYIAILAYEELKLINLTDGTEQTIEDQLQNCDGIGGGGLKGLYWSPNNRYFYYTDWREGNPEGCGNYIMPMIYRFDTLTQENLPVGGGHLSPDETRLAMWEWQKNEIAVWDLDEGEIARVQGLVPGFLHGEISWAPDSQSLVYLQTQFDCAPDYGTTYAIKLDLANLRQRLLLKSPPPGYGGVSWDGADQLTLTDGQGKQWNFDVESREFGLSTATPAPPGIFPMYFYPPLTLNYDISAWKLVNIGVLQALTLRTCQLEEIGPSGNFPADVEPVRVGDVEYLFSFSEISTPGMTAALYLENQSLDGYDYALGLPVLMVIAHESEWEECKALGEDVLSTLHAP